MKKLLLLIIALMAFSSMTIAQWNIAHESGFTVSNSDLFFLNADTGYVLGAVSPLETRVLRTKNGGANWDSTHFDGFSARSIHFPSPDTGYISGFTNGGSSLSVMRTINAGDTWELVATDLRIGSFHAIPIRFLNNNIGFISHPGFFAKTNDAGLTWEVMEEWSSAGPLLLEVIDNKLVGAGGAYVMSTDDFGNSFLYTILDFMGNGVHMNIDLRGNDFISCSGGYNGIGLGFPTWSFGIVSIGSFTNETHNTTYFPTRHRIWDVAWPGVDVMYGISTSIYLGDDYPHFFIKSIDGGQTWYEQGTPEYGYPGTNRLACPTEEVCYAVGGFGGKIYKTSNGGGPLLDPIDQVVLSTAEPVTAAVLTLHPNPAHTHTTVTSAQQPMERLALYDLQGRVVHEAQPAGLTYRIPLTGLPAGMYVVSVQIGGEVVRKKLVVGR